MATRVMRAKLLLLLLSALILVLGVQFEEFGALGLIRGLRLKRAGVFCIGGGFRFKD